MTTAAATPKTEPKKPATRAADLVTTYRKAAKEVEDVVGVVPDGVRRACIAAVVRACLDSGRQELGFVAARDVIAGVIRAEIDGA